ncbi:MAG: hypothetical protein WC435_03475 [Candidatus Paceibacterota bacterium]
MNLTVLAHQSFGGLGCPQILRSEEGRIFVVGKVLNEEEKGEIANVGEGEDVVEISSSLLREIEGKV